MTEIFRAEGPDIAFLSACYQKTEEPIAREAAMIREEFLKGDDSLCLYLSYRNGQILGFIQGFPADHPLSLVKGENLYTVGCMFAPGKVKGTGRNLLYKLEETAREKGARGMALIAFSESAHMPVEFFKKLGYTVQKRHRNAHILVKSFDLGPIEADFVEPTLPALEENTLHVFYSPLCFASVRHALEVKALAEEKTVPVLLHDAGREGTHVTEGVYYGNQKVKGDWKAFLETLTQ